MAKISRATQLIFGSTGGTSNFAKFGSLAAGTPQTYSSSTITPALIQALANYLQGWFGAVVGANSPAIEDMNSLFYLLTYQIAYGFQSGVPEWDSATTYYTGSLVNDGSGNLYASIVDNNTNNVLTDGTKWKPASGRVNLVSINPATQSPYTLGSGDSGKIFLVNTANGTMQFNLPAGSANLYFEIKDSAGSMGSNNITIHRNAAESIEGVAADYICASPWGEFVFACNGTNWFITGR